MKIGILADWLGLGVEGGIREAARMGADGVQLYAVEGELAPEHMNAEKRGWLRRLVADEGLEISALCGDLGEGGFAFAERNPQKTERTKRIIDLALDADCRIVTTHIGVVPHDAAHPRFAVIADALAVLGEYAAGRGAVLAIETGPEPAADLKRMLDTVASPGIKVNFDPANLVMCRPCDAADEARVLGKAIVHTHAKDGVLIKPCDMDVMYAMTTVPEDFDESDYCAETPLGEGQVSFDRYLAALREIGFDGYLTIEREMSDPVRDIRLAVAYLKKKV